MREMFAERKNSGPRIDPRVKLFMVPVAGITVFLIESSLVIFLMSLLIALFMMMAGNIRHALRSICFFASTLLLEKLAALSGNTSIAILLLTLVYVLQRFCLLVMIGLYILKTTSVSELICSLEKLRLPRQVSVPLSVSFRFMPTIHEEYGYLKDSMRVRGIKLSPGTFILHPVRTIEFSIIPLLMRSIRISDELAASAMVRGLDSGYRKTPLYELRMRAVDYLYLLFYLSSIAALYLLDKNIF